MTDPEAEAAPHTTLAPRPAPPDGTTSTRGRKLRLWLALAVIVGAVGFLLLQGLDSATVYYRNADEAVADRDELGGRRFNLQGTVVRGSVDEVGDGVEFDVEFEDVVVAVLHRGDPPELFQPGIPVVLEGRWEGDRFASDRIMVKHSSEYKAENPDRVDPGAP